MNVNITYARGSKSLNMSFDACVFAPTPGKDRRCCGLRGVRISPIPGRGENAGDTTDAERILLVGACSWFIWLGGVMKGTASGGCCWFEIVVTSDNEML
jgi:hypothetical protein